MSIWMALIGTALTALSALIGVLWTAAQSRQAARDQAAVQVELARTAPYDIIAQQVQSLNTRVSHLEQEQHVDRSYVHALLVWIGRHGPADKVPPAPPDWYARYYPYHDGGVDADISK